ncbi:MAG TPA: mannitol dehydrogenase family protein [Rhodanobacteraceae bacterium]
MSGAPASVDAGAAPAARPRLSRAALGDTVRAAPVRIVHMGLGNFHRAHQAWYTARSDDAAGWGIAAFTGRSPAAARELAAQEGLYTLIERAGDGDRASIVGSISRACDGADLAAFCAMVAAPATALVTLTITEPGYHLNAAGDLDSADALVAADVAQLAAHSDAAAPVTPLARLALGLHARYRAGGAPLAVVPCDNLPGNGALVARAVAKLAACEGAGFARWIGRAVAFVSTSVDRITPRCTAADAATACRLTGWTDRVPVVTESFSDWVLQGDFPAGRPRWESAGARFVGDVRPFERRKLWLLNGAHSLLAYRGLLRGHATVAAAMNDADLRAAVERLWMEARRHLPAVLDLDSYCSALRTRFANARIEHRLAQIGMDGVAKLRVRVVPVAQAELAAGRDAEGCAGPIAAWVACAQRGLLPPDASAAALSAALAQPPAARVRALVALLAADLAGESGFMHRVRTGVDRLCT